MRWFPALLLAACPHPTAPPPAPAPTSPAKPTPPATRTVEATETLFGTTVSDPYRWMETGGDELTTWLRAQGAFTADFLGKIPGREALAARITELGDATGSPGSISLAGGRLFYLYAAPGDQLAKLYVREKGTDRVLVDPAGLGDPDHHASIESYAPSPDGSRVAYDLALGGGEISTIRVLDVATGKDLPDAVERVWGEFTASWLPDGKSFAYTQMAAPVDGVDPMLNMQVRLHVLGTGVDKDVALFGGGVGAVPVVEPAEFPGIGVEPGSPWVALYLGGARNERRVSVARASALDRTGAGKTPWKPVAEYADSVGGAIAHGDRLYLSTFAGASNRKIESTPSAAPDLQKARVDLPEDPTESIVNYTDARDALYVLKQIDGQSRLYRWPYAGDAVEIPLPFEGWVDEMAADPLRDGVTFGEEGWTRPIAYYSYDPAKRKVAPIGLAAVTNADYTGIVAEEAEATSADGVKVPISILHRADIAADGARPAIVYGYGGYGISQTPAFSPTRLAWLERGGVVAICHVRGGGERGHQWQVDGTHDHKMNGVHDFEACAQTLADRHFTNADHTFAQGGSMGGILVGRALTERPDLFAAANVQVGMVDPVRILAAGNGANQLAELGDPRTEAGFAAIYAMSPYAHATAQRYPATLFTVGLHDQRVDPWMSAKMCARMQAVTTGDQPILLRVEEDAGHGIGSTRAQTWSERADVWSFFLAVSGESGFVPD